MSKPKKKKRKKKHPTSILVCGRCGSKKVQVKAWVDANTNRYVDEADAEDAYCERCEDHIVLTSLAEFNTR